MHALLGAFDFSDLLWWAIGNTGWDILKFFLKVGGVAAFVSLAKWVRNNTTLQGWMREGIFFVCIMVICTLFLALLHPILAGQRGPRLKTQANEIGLGQMGGGDPTALVFFCSMDIYNSGSPSIIRDLRMFVTPPNSSPIPAKTFLPGAMSPTNVIQVPSGFGGINSISKSDWLLEKAGSTPIPLGGNAKGFGVFQLSGYSTNVICQPGTRFSVTFKDVDDKEYHCDYFWK